MSESENEIDKNIFLMSDTLLSPEDIAMHLTRFDPNVNRYTDSLTDSFPNGSQVYLVHKPNPKNEYYILIIYTLTYILIIYLNYNDIYSHTS